MLCAHSYLYNNNEYMKNTINTYLAILLITIAGVGAVLIIVHISDANAFTTTMGGSEANYSSLQQSILKQ